MLREIYTEVSAEGVPRARRCGQHSSAQAFDLDPNLLSDRVIFFNNLSNYLEPYFPYW